MRVYWVTTTERVNKGWTEIMTTKVLSVVETVNKNKWAILSLKSVKAEKSDVLLAIIFTVFKEHSLQNENMRIVGEGGK